MPDLIPIRETAIDGGVRQTVNASDLHAFLKVSTKFADWMTRRIEQYGFTESVDFVVFLNSEKNSGRPLKEYHLTLDMAKELSMVERTAKGKEARQYFLECERKAQEGQASMTMAERLLASAQLLVDHERKLADLSYRQAETQAQVKALVDGEDYYTVVGYGNLIGELVDTPRARRIGKTAAGICRAQGWRMGTANHPVYGPINSYPRQAIALAFDQEAP